VGGADGEDSSDSEWGEFASFDEATPSKRGGRRRHQQQHLHRHASSYKVAGVNMFGFFSEYEVSSQVTSLMSVLKAAADTVSKSNSGESCAAVVPSSCSRSWSDRAFAAFAQLERIFEVEDGEGQAAAPREIDEIMFDER
jgi:hypothetical protein